MKHALQIFTLIVICAGIACVSYDAPQIYHKNFRPGTHPLLRFDGWYTPVTNVPGMIKPVFFYRDGSVWFGEQAFSSTDNDVAIGSGTIAHSWGNYQIIADTILLERFYKAETSDNYNRIILKGIIQTDNIHWILRTADRENPDTVNYDMKFEEHKVKPDSTRNWTRTRPQFNK